MGFSVPPFDGPGCPWVENSKSVKYRMDIVRAKIQSKIDEGRRGGPFLSPPFSVIIC